MTALEDFVGGQAVEVFVTQDGTSYELAPEMVGPITISHGRPDSESRAEPATLGLAVFAAAFTVRTPDLGDEVLVNIGSGTATWLGIAAPARRNYRRFRGRISDLAHGGGKKPVISIVATSSRGRWNAMPAVAVGEHVESAGQIAARIFNDTSLDPLDLDTGAFASGGNKVVTTDSGANPWYECKTIADQIGLLSVSGPGELIEKRDGTITWQDPTSRTASTPSAVSLQASEVLLGSQTGKNYDGLANRLVLTYGEGVADAGQSSVDTNDSDSLAQHGLQDAGTLVTILADSVEAPGNDSPTALLRDYLDRHAFPAWSMPTLDVELARAKTDPATWRAKVRALLLMEVSSLIELTGETGLPLPDPQLLWVEGWTEYIDAHGWRLSVTSSDYRLGGFRVLPDTYDRIGIEPEGW